MNIRLLNLKSLMAKNNLDAALVSSIPNIIYLTGYSGFFTSEREGFLLIYKNKQYFITDARSSNEIKKQVKDFELAEISASFPLKKLLEKLANNHKIKQLGIEENNLTVSEFKLVKKYFNTKRLDVNELRKIKDSDEISKIKKACELGDKAFDYILKEIKFGITERELASKIEIFIKQNLADISFPPIVAFGKNSAIPHHVPTNNNLTNNQIVLLDFGVRLNNYCSDMTRTVFFGAANSKLKKMYNTVLEAQTKAIALLKQHCHSERSEESRSFANAQDDIKIMAKNVDKVARDYIISKGYKTIPHSLGHGIGLEVHELPKLSPASEDILKENMVFSVEPGIYLSNFGGVRIEDLVVLENNGPRFLTHCSKQLITL